MKVSAFLKLSKGYRLF